MRRLLLSLVLLFSTSFPVPFGFAQDGGTMCPSPFEYCVPGGHGYVPWIELLPGGSASFYVVSVPYTWFTAGGVNGAEFRIRGKPDSGLLLHVEPHPMAAYVLGNPFEEGVNIGFSECQTPGETGTIVLFTVTAVDVGLKSEVTLWVDRHATPSNPWFECPLVNSCDNPLYTPRCVVGLEMLIRPTTSVESRAWSVMKSLYQ